MTHFLFANTYSSVKRCKRIVMLFDSALSNLIWDFRGSAGLASHPYL